MIVLAIGTLPFSLSRSADAILGHVTPEMTLRYAHLASDTIRTGSDSAIAKTRSKMRLVASAAGQFVTDRIEWLHSEMIRPRRSRVLQPTPRSRTLLLLEHLRAMRQLHSR